MLAEVSALTGVEVDRYVAVNFDGFAQIIDALGGAYINADREFSERFFFPDGSTDVLTLQQGMNHLSGMQALMFARSRKFDPAGDYARICRQQQVLAALKTQVLSPRTLLAVPGILREVSKSVVTNVTLGELIVFLKTAISIPTENMRAATISSDGMLSSPTRGNDGAYLIRAHVEAINGHVQSLMSELDSPAPPPATGTSATYDNCSMGITEVASP